jgi:hypothetical protein
MISKLQILIFPVFGYWQEMFLIVVMILWHADPLLGSGLKQQRNGVLCVVCQATIEQQ